MKTPRDVEGDLATEELVDPAEATASAGAIIAPKEVVGRSPWEIFWRQFRKDRWALAGIVIVVIMLLLAITAPLFARIVHHGPNDVNLRALDDFGLPSGPSKEYWFGVDGPAATSSSGCSTGRGRRSSSRSSPRGWRS